MSLAAGEPGYRRHLGSPGIAPPCAPLLVGCYLKDFVYVLVSKEQGHRLFVHNSDEGPQTMRRTVGSTGDGTGGMLETGQQATASAIAFLLGKN